jgi:hypothetical protein
VTAVAGSQPRVVVGVVVVGVVVVIGISSGRGRQPALSTRASNGPARLRQRRRNFFRKSAMLPRPGGG